MAVEIDWSSSKVDGGELSVGLTGDASRKWVKRLGAVIDRLSRHGHWGEIKARKAGLKVAEVQEGAEEELRFFLESAVLQANAGEDEPDEGDDESDEGDEPGPDERMTETFRSFRQR